jgi:hypothetical protein
VIYNQAGCSGTKLSLKQQTSSARFWHKADVHRADVRYERKAEVNSPLTMIAVCCEWIRLKK